MLESRVCVINARMVDIDTEKEKTLLAEVAMFEKRAVLFSSINRLLMKLRVHT